MTQFYDPHTPTLLNRRTAILSNPAQLRGTPRSRPDPRFSQLPYMYYLVTTTRDADHPLFPISLLKTQSSTHTPLGTLPAGLSSDHYINQSDFVLKGLGPAYLGRRPSSLGSLRQPINAHTKHSIASANAEQPIKSHTHTQHTHLSVNILNLNRRT